MKIIVMVLCIGMTGMGATLTCAQEELPLATGEWPPYTSENLEGYGFFTELMTAIVHKMGMKPTYHFYPWKRAEEVTRHGKVFGAFPYAVTKERKQHFDFSDLIMKNRTLFFYHKKHLKKKIEINTLEDLKPYRTGGVLGYNYVPVFAEAGLNVDYVVADEQNVKKLYLNRIDIAVLDTILGWHLIQKLYPNESDVFGTSETTLGAMVPSLQDGSYLMISRSYPNAEQLRDRFNQALQRIKESGTCRAIFKKYGIREPEK